MTRAARPIAYGRLPLVVYAIQCGPDFHLELGRDDALGFTPAGGPILRAHYPGHGAARQARAWFREHCEQHGITLIFD